MMQINIEFFRDFFHFTTPLAIFVYCFQILDQLGSYVETSANEIRLLLGDIPYPKPLNEAQLLWFEENYFKKIVKEQKGKIHKRGRYLLGLGLLAIIILAGGIYSAFKKQGFGTPLIISSTLVLFFSVLTGESICAFYESHVEKFKQLCIEIFNPYRRTSTGEVRANGV